jgi:hypothetical protein
VLRGREERLEQRARAEAQQRWHVAPALGAVRRPVDQERHEAAQPAELGVDDLRAHGAVALDLAVVVHWLKAPSSPFEGGN